MAAKKKTAPRRRMLSKISCKAEDLDYWRKAHARAEQALGAELSFAAWVRAALNDRAERDLRRR